MSIGALRIRRRLWQIVIGVSLSVSAYETCTDACLFTPLALVCFCLLTRGPLFGATLGRTVLSTLDLAGPALANASAASLYTLCPYTCVTSCVCVCVCVCVCDINLRFVM